MATVFGLPVAPVAVTVTVALRADVVVFAATVTIIEPEPVPLDGDKVIQDSADAAVHGIVPVPVLATFTAKVPPA